MMEQAWAKLVTEWAANLQDLYRSLVKLGLEGNDPNRAEKCRESIHQLKDLSEWSQLTEALKTEPTAKKCLQVAESTYQYYYAGKQCLKLLSQATPEGSNYGETQTSSGLTISPYQWSEITRVRDVCQELRLQVRDSCQKLYQSWASLPSDLDTAWITSQHNIINYSYWCLYLNLVLTKTADRAEIMRYVEVLKTESLGQDTEPAPELTDPISILVQTYRWVPSEPDLPLSELLAQVLPEFKGSGLAEAAKCGVRILEIVKPSHLAHRYRIITDVQYVKDLGLAIVGKEGISEKYLKSTETIVPIEAAKSAKVTVYGSSGPWIVLETLNGTDYHYLRPWANPEPKIPKHWIQLAPSVRVKLLNQAVSTEIINKIGAPLITMQMLSRDEVVQEETYWKNLRSRIRKSAVPRLPKGQFKTGESVLAAVRKSDYYEAVLDAITAEITIGQASSWWEGLGAARQQFVQREIALTHAMHIAKIRDSLRQTQEANYTHKSDWATAWDSAMEETLSRYINRKSSLYLALDSKMLLLRKALA